MKYFQTGGSSNRQKLAGGRYLNIVGPPIPLIRGRGHVPIGAVGGQTAVAANRVGGKLRKAVIAELVDRLHSDGYVISGICSSVGGKVGIPVLRCRREDLVVRVQRSQLPLAV